MIDAPDCLCLHALEQHADELFCLAPGCRCLNYEADPCGVEEPRHSQHTRPVLGCFDCEDAMSEARALQAEAPWWDEQS